CTPELMRNYVGKGNMTSELKEEVPPIFITDYQKTDDHIELYYEIGYWRPMPFGLAYWDDLDGYEVETAVGAEGVTAKLIKNKLVFLRFQLTGEPVRIKLTLT